MGMVGIKVMAPIKVIILVMKVMIMDLEVMKVMAVAMVVVMMVIEIIVYGGGKVMVKAVVATLVVMTMRGRM